MTIDSIGFDLDGTLWDGTEAIAGAWKMCMSGKKEIKRIPGSDELKGVMGMPLNEIMLKFFPYLDEDQRDDLMAECRKADNEYIRKNGGKPFENLEETLKNLSEKYKLYIVSNCQAGYIEAFLEYYRFDKYFIDHECIGRTGQSKGRNILSILERNDLKNTIYIGDTQGDYDAAKEAGVPFIFAEYGFGQINDDVKVIKSFEELSVIF